MKAMRLAAAAALVALSCGTAAAQSALRIGLAEDPDVLDPTLARTYVGRIVFASICDKLFDIDAKLNVMPQLALSHETSEDGKTVTIKLRPRREIPRRREVRRRGREVLARTPHDHAGLVPQAGACRDRQGRGRRSADDQAACSRAPFSPLIAQLTDRAGMMVSPKAAKEAGDKFGLKPVCAGPLQVRRARAAGPHRGREIRRLLGQGQASTSTASPICRSSTRRCGSPICAPAGST